MFKRNLKVGDMLVAHGNLDHMGSSCGLLQSLVFHYQVVTSIQVRYNKLMNFLAKFFGPKGGSSMVASL